MRLRQAVAADAEAVRAILYDTFDSTWRPAITPGAAAAFIAEDRPGAYVGERLAEFWIAERGGAIAGFIHWRQDFVHALHVRSGQARTGVGSALMDLAETAIASEHGQCRLETDTFNLRSQAFYGSRGYLEADRYPDLEWNSGLTTLLLVKRLKS